MNFSAKFRAFQLDSPGSLFSFYKRNTYTLIEARLPKGGTDILKEDLAYHSKEQIDVLHITSWEKDHCSYDDLVQIINKFRPNKIQVPSYVPQSNDGKLCHGLICKYDEIHQKYVRNVEIVSKLFIESLPYAKPFGTPNVAFQPEFESPNKNDLSLIWLFRSESFSVLSVGDCESESIANRLITYDTIRTEVDVYILAHHGANNGFTSSTLLDQVNPAIGVCSSNLGNNYDHPRQEVRTLFSNKSIPLMTTKRGDVVIYSTIENPGEAVAVNMASNNEIEESREGFIPKRFLHK